MIIERMKTMPPELPSDIKDKFRIRGTIFPDPRPGCQGQDMALVFDLDNERFLLLSITELEIDHDGTGTRRGLRER